MDNFTLADFVRESNRIEGMIRRPYKREIEAHEFFLRLPISIPSLEAFVRDVQPGAKLRRLEGMDVRVGSHLPPRGGNSIESMLIEILRRERDPFQAHQAYETLGSGSV